MTAASLIGIVALVPRVAQAQKVAAYDFTDAKPLERLRPPLPSPPRKYPPKGDPSHLPPPPKPAADESGEGACSGVLQNPPIIVSLVSLGRDSYTFGDEFTFIVGASRATTVPVRASLAEVEPVDPSKSYEWQPRGISLGLRDPKYRSPGFGFCACTVLKTHSGRKLT